MPENEGGVFYNLQTLLNQDYRGVNVCILGSYDLNLRFITRKV